MLRKIALSMFAVVGFATLANAQGTAPEAKAMLEKAVAAVKADKAKALTSFNAGTDGFKDRDLYPFCFNGADGLIVAGPVSVMGKDTRTLKDATSKPYGEELFKAGQGATITEVSYMFPKPGQTQPSAKISFVTKVGDLGCGVGYYK